MQHTLTQFPISRLSLPRRMLCHVWAKCLGKAQRLTWDSTLCLLDHNALSYNACHPVRYVHNLLPVHYHQIGQGATSLIVGTAARSAEEALFCRSLATLSVGTSPVQHMLCEWLRSAPHARVLVEFSRPSEHLHGFIALHCEARLFKAVHATLHLQSSGLDVLVAAWDGLCLPVASRRTMWRLDRETASRHPNHLLHMPAHAHHHHSCKQFMYSGFSTMVTFTGLCARAKYTERVRDSGDAQFFLQSTTNATSLITTFGGGPLSRMSTWSRNKQTTGRLRRWGFPECDSRSSSHSAQKAASKTYCCRF
jgi:hypothetical protein